MRGQNRVAFINSRRAGRFFVAHRFEPDETAIGLVGKDVQQPVGPLTDVSYPLADSQGRLADDLAGFIQIDAPDVLGFQTADK